MDSKKIRKSISDFFSWLALKICSLIIKITPGFLVYGVAKYLSLLIYALLGKKRNIALESLSIAFGQEKSKAEIEEIARDCFVYMGKGGIEILYFLDKPDLLRARVEIEGKEKLDAALAKGKGIILLSAHFGNFPLMLARLSQEGYKVSAIMRYMRNERIEKLFASSRRKFGVKTIYSQPRKVCVEDTIRSLRGNELIFVLLDQNFGTAGVFVDFFGRKAATATGPLILARRTGAQIMPCFIVRNKDDTHKIIVDEPFQIKEEQDYNKTIVSNIQRLTDIIELYIRKYPAQWGWIHRRWKSRPNLERGGV